MPDNVNIVGQPARELFPKHLFLVQVDPTWSAGFQKCSELSMELAKIEYWEGGSIIPWKVPGRVTITDVTLERGASRSRAFYNWAMQTANASIFKKPTRGIGDVAPGYLKNIDIIQMDRDARDDPPVAKWRLHNAWIQKFVAGDWDNTADEVVIETLTLTFDFFTRESI